MTAVAGAPDKPMFETLVVGALRRRLVLGEFKEFEAAAWT